MMNLKRLSILSIIVAGCTFGTTPLVAQTFPLEIPNKFGTTIIPAKPERVATVDGNGADNILALGIQPVTIENWYGGYEHGLWPWASPLLQTTPVMLERGNLNFEAIASSNPDVILSLYNALTPEEYEKLTQIAPVVAVPEGRSDWSLNWEERAHMTGLATGNEAKAQEKIAGIKSRLKDIAATHPEWAGKTAVIGWVSRKGDLGVYSSHDSRQQILNELGFVTPQAVDDLDPNGSSTVYLSEESVELLNVDLLVWIRGDYNVQPILDLPTRDFIEPHVAGREIIFTKEVTGAFSYGSLLSMPFAIGRLEKAIVAALDGDPNTNADDRPDNW